MERTWISRRRFLALGAGVGLTAGGTSVLGACGAGEGPEVGEGQEMTGETDLDPGSAFTFTDAANGGPAVLVRLPDGGFAAYSTECTHQGCTVSYNNGASGGGYLGCPCHNSVFEPAEGGRVLSGPAEKPLPKIPVEAEEAGPEDAEHVLGLPTAGDKDLIQSNHASEDWISRGGAQDRSFKGTPERERTADTRASRTDPDASPMRWSGNARRLGYQTHYVVDGGKSRIILSVLVTPGEVSENRPMLDLLWRTAFRWKLRPHHVTGDGKYGTIENIGAVEGAGIRAYVALHKAGGRGGFFPKSAFAYDAEEDIYLCPSGEPLRALGDAEDNRIRGRIVTYRAKGSVCAACSLKPRCTTNKNGRSLRRGPGDEHIDLVRAYMETEPYLKAIRKVWIEPLFAEGKLWHGLRRFRTRTLEKVNTEALTIAAGQNVKRLLAFRGMGPKKLAQAAALRPPARPLPDLARRSFPSKRSSLTWALPSPTWTRPSRSGTRRWVPSVPSPCPGSRRCSKPWERQGSRWAW